MSKPDAQETMLKDIDDLIAAIGMPAHARPYSAHRMMQEEIIPAVHAMRAELEVTDYALGMYEVYVERLVGVHELAVESLRQLKAIRDTLRLIREGKAEKQS